MPDKTSKVHQEAVKFVRYSGPFGSRTCANLPFLCKQRYMSCYSKYAYIIVCVHVYTSVVGRGQQALLLKIFRHAHKLFALIMFMHCASIRTYTVPSFHISGFLRWWKIAHSTCSDSQRYMYIDVVTPQ